MPVDVRPATPQECGELAALAARTFALSCPPSASPEDISAHIATHLTAENFAGYIADAERQVAVAVLDGDYVGYTMVVLTAPAPDIAGQLTAALTAEVSKIYVDPAHHGGGVARALLDSAVSHIRELGRAGVWLGTNQANQRAQRFYEKHGFAQVGTRGFLLGSDWQNDVIYERVLGPRAT